MEPEHQSTMEALLFQLSYCPNLSLKEKYRLMNAVEEADNSVSSLAYRSGLSYKSREVFLKHYTLFNEKTEKNTLHEWGIRWISRNHPDFPEQLKEIYDAPLGLFCRGNIEWMQQKSLSVVGARNCTSYGRKILSMLLPDIIQQQYIIVSGLAKGIDTEAHQLTIKEGGRTIAVIGSGIDIVYPAENKELQQTIGRQHLLLSEYPPGTTPLKQHFPMRNRLIAGLSMGTLVVEAKYRSGSLITANLALNEGREVFAVPGSLLNPLSEGTNDLIKHGAKCVLSSKDIMEELVYG